MRTVRKYLRVVGVHTLYQFPVLLCTFGSQFTVSAFGFRSQLFDNAQGTLAVGCKLIPLCRFSQNTQGYVVFFLFGEVA